MFANGDGVTKDKAEALKWYRKAADQGHAKAQYALGWMFANGDGVTMIKRRPLNGFTRQRIRDMQGLKRLSRLSRNSDTNNPYPSPTEGIR